MPTHTANNLLWRAVALPARLLRTLFLPRAPGIADLSPAQLADIGLLPSDVPRRGWSGSADAEIAARLGRGRDRPAP